MDHVPDHPVLLDQLLDHPRSLDHPKELPPLLDHPKPPLTSLDPAMVVLPSTPVPVESTVMTVALAPPPLLLQETDSEDSEVLVPSLSLEEVQESLVESADMMPELL